LVLLRPFALVVSSGAAVFLSVPSPVSCEKGSSSRELYASPESCRSVSGPLSSCDEPESRPSWGLACPLRGVSLARFLDGIPPHRTPSRRFARPRQHCAPSLAGLFRPATTSRVHSSGVLPLTQPLRLVAESCPLVVGAECCRQLPASATLFCLALRAFSPCEDPVSSRQCLATATTRSPLELLPPPGVLPQLCDDAFTPSAARGLTKRPSLSLSCSTFSVPESRWAGLSRDCLPARGS